MPVAANSERMIATIGAAKNLGYNLDMNFVIVRRTRSGFRSTSSCTPPIPIRALTRCRPTPHRELAAGGE